MNYRKVHTSLMVSADAYTLRFSTDRPFVLVDDGQHRRLASLFYLSSVHPQQGRDDTIRIGQWQVEEKPGEICLTLETRSSVWERKLIRFRCQPKRFLYEVEVEGRGLLSDVDFFGGYYSGQVRWGTGFFYSGQNFQRGFTPEPNSDEQNYFRPSEQASIGLTGVPLPGRADWFFTPPPFCFALKGGSGWLALGLQAQPGANIFSEYRYHGGRDCFHLSLALDSHTQVAGAYTLPAISVDFAPSEYQALQAYVQAMQADGCAPLPSSAPQPAWWHEPIYCGWGSQCYESFLIKGKAPDFSRQALYETWLSTLEQNQVNPGIVVLDDKWQAAYGDNPVDEKKWPDLPGFVARQHAQGRKVLLWLKAWDPEGVPPEECVTNAAGLPVAVDPTNPAYEARLRQSVQRMLSPDGYNADGFKIDFTARIPSGPGLCLYGDAWGLELMKLYLGILYSEAKRVKPEALVMAHTPNPYLADVLDMIRLNDINTQHNVNIAMTLRARVASIACPGAIIDTDNWPIPSRKVWRQYLKLQPDLGVPSLYYASHIDSTREPLRPRDYQLIRESWAIHRAKLAQQTAGGKPASSTLGGLARFWQSLAGRINSARSPKAKARPATTG